MEAIIYLIQYAAVVLSCIAAAFICAFRSEIYQWLKSGIQRKKIIYGCEARGDAHEPYLTRFIIFYGKKIKIYFHKFHRSDAVDLHDHPWNFVSIILWRGYMEEVPDGSAPGYRKQKRVWPGMIIYRPAHHAHRVVLLNEKPAYTLVFVSKYVRQWGFFTSRGWMNYKNYFTEKGC